MVDGWLKDYKDNGFAIIPEVFSREETNQIRLSAWKAFRKPGAIIQWRNDYPALMFWPRHTHKFKSHPALMRIVKSVLGDGPLHHLNHQYYFRLPGDGDNFAWHQDICFRAPVENFKDIENGYLQTAIIVDDMDSENGGIHFLPGSHKDGDLGLIKRGTEDGLRSEFDQTKYKSCAPVVKSGDVLIWSVMVVHGSAKNESTRTRSYLMNGYARSECIVDQKSYPMV